LNTFYFLLFVLSSSIFTSFVLFACAGVHFVIHGGISFVALSFIILTFQLFVHFNIHIIIILNGTDMFVIRLTGST